MQRTVNRAELNSQTVNGPREWRVPRRIKRAIVETASWILAVALFIVVWLAWGAVILSWGGTQKSIELGLGLAWFPLFIAVGRLRKAAHRHFFPTEIDLVFASTHATT